jgi:chromosome segregation ATPase
MKSMRPAALVAMVVMLANGGGGTLSAQTATQPDGPSSTDATARIASLQRDLEALTGSKIADPDRLRARLSELESQADSLLPTLAGKKARLDAINAKIRDLTNKAQADINQDAILQELKKSCRTREEAADRLKTLLDRSLASQADLDAAINGAADARVQVEQRREYILATIAGGSIPALNKELVDVSLDISEETAILDVLQKRQKDVRDAIGIAAEIARLSTSPRQAGR